LDVLVIDDPLAVAGHDVVAARVISNFDDFPEELVGLRLSRARIPLKKVPVPRAGSVVGGRDPQIDRVVPQAPGGLGCAQDRAVRAAAPVRPIISVQARPPRSAPGLLPRFSNRPDRRRTTAWRRGRRCDGLSNLEAFGCLRILPRALQPLACWR